MDMLFRFGFAYNKVFLHAFVTFFVCCFLGVLASWFLLFLVSQVLAALDLLFFAVSWQYAATIVQTTCSTSIRRNRRPTIMLIKKGEIQCEPTKTRAGMLVQSAANRGARMCQILQHQNAAKTIKYRSDKTSRMRYSSSIVQITQLKTLKNCKALKHL